jgi:hypothetical protein
VCRAELDQHGPLVTQLMPASRDAPDGPSGSIQACRHPPIDFLPVDLPGLECGGGQLP